MKNVMAAFLSIGLGAAPACAIEVAGGSVGLSYSAFTDDTEHHRLSFEGSAELAFSPTVSGQFDLGRDKFGMADMASTTLGLHGIYHLSKSTSFGAFYTSEDVEKDAVSTNSDVYGIEFGHMVGRTEFESYVGLGDTGKVDGTVLGLSGRFEMSNGIGLAGSFDYVDVTGLEAGKIAVRLDNNVSDNLNLYVEVGSAKARAFGIAESEPYVGLGGKILFGAEKGATFERRGLSRVLPGL
jgi:hypothetical protein